MIPLATSPTDALAAFVRGWFVALAEGHDADAVAMLDEPNPYGIA